MKAIFVLFVETFRQWNAHRVPRMGAALSCYAVFSLAPLAVIMLSLISLAVERNAARIEIVGQFRSFVGNEGAEMVEMILARTAAANADVNITLIGLLVLMIGSSAVFGELQDSLNQIWEVASKRHPIFTLVRERAYSFLMVFVMGFLMLASFLYSAAFAVASSYLHARIPGLDGPWELGNSVVSLLVIALLFALIYRVVPDAPITWKDVWLGSLIAAVLFVLGKFMLGFYFGRSAFASSYGAAGSLIIIQVWVFYSAQIMFFGAEFTHVYALRYGSHRKVGAEGMSKVPH